jgi:hypothetical protein
VQLTAAHRAESWSPAEEQIIAAIQQAEAVPRAEAIRRMRLLKLDDLRGRIRRLFEAAGDRTRGPGRAPGRWRVYRNALCVRGDDGGPGSLTHLRADAVYCNDACRMAARRSPKPQNWASNRQCLCGSKPNRIGSLVSPPWADE